MIRSPARGRRRHRPRSPRRRCHPSRQRRHHRRRVPISPKTGQSTLLRRRGRATLCRAILKNRAFIAARRVVAAQYWGERFTGGVTVRCGAWEEADCTSPAAGNSVGCNTNVCKRPELWDSGTQQWCAGCARKQPGETELIGAKMCETCNKRRPSYARPAERKVRWCVACGPAHGAIFWSVPSRTRALAQGRASASSSPSGVSGASPL